MLAVLEETLVAAGLAGEWKTALTMMEPLVKQLGMNGKTVGVFFGIFAIPYGSIEQFACAHHVLGHRRVGHGCGLFVDVNAVDLLGGGQIVGVFFDQAPAFVLR